ncbi:MAG: hypothetical protein R2706_00510 [Acidimicrobiales bacterium]
MQASATAAWADLGLPTELGDLTLCDSIDDAVAGAFLIQESVPERLALSTPLACFCGEYAMRSSARVHLRLQAERSS